MYLYVEEAEERQVLARARSVGGQGDMEQGECEVWLPRGYGRAGERLRREYVFLTFICRMGGKLIPI